MQNIKSTKRNLGMSDMKEKSLWFVRIAEGNKEAFDAFFKHYYPKLIQFACIFVNSTQQAEDVVSEVLTNILIHRERVFALDHFEAYLYSSVKNKALTANKKQQRTSSFAQERQNVKPLSATSSDPHQLLADQEFHLLIRKVINDLPPKRKMVFQLIREEQLSYRQVAELMNISERTVEVHLKLAVKTLRQATEQYLRANDATKSMHQLVKNLSPLLFYYLLP